MANDSLAQWRLNDSVRFVAIEFVELYQDLALQAAAKLNDAIADPDLNQVFTPLSEITILDGGRRRVSFEEAPGWWDRLQILADPDGKLRYTALTDRARAEVSLLPAQRALVDQFLDQAVASTTSNERLASTLFELLLPNELKEHTREQRDLVIVLNNETAAYPWELLHDGLRNRSAGPNTNEGYSPLAIQAGMIRQREDNFCGASEPQHLGCLPMLR